MKVKHFRLELLESLHSEIKVAAVKQGATMHDFIIQAIQDRLKEMEQNEKSSN